MTDLLPASGSPRPSTRASASATALLLALAAAACSPAASQPPGSAPPTGGPTGSPAPTAGPTTAAGGLEHPTGARDVVLRVGDSGGHMMVEFAATSAPSFTLYGDGTVVFRHPNAPMPEPVGNVSRSVPFQIVRLDKGGIQALLQEALGPGGLAIATGPYMGMTADIPTTTFAINAGGKSKTVDVVGLSPEAHPQEAALIIGQLSRFAERLNGFADDVAGESPYIPHAYRGVLIPVDRPFGPVIEWPWTDLQPDDFVAGENEFFLTRTLTPAEVATLGIPDAAGGIMGVALEKDGKIYTFLLRPLLPDEEA